MKCRKSPTYFLTKYGRVKDPGKGIVPFESWNHLLELLALFAKYRLLILAKARQIGITWLVAGFALHKALFNQGANILILSKGQDEASEVLDYCRFMLSQLPTYLAAELDRNRLQLLSFPNLNSKIRALPAKEDAGIGFGGATLLISDEFHFHDYAERNYSEIKPMIDAGGNRQWIILSAKNVNPSSDKFMELFIDACERKNSFYPVFIPMGVLDYRTDAWYAQVCKDLELWEAKAKYPRTLDEFLAPVGAASYFDSDTLARMLKEYVISPIETRHNGNMRIYQMPVTGRKYCMAWDSSGGYDPFAGAVMDWQSCEVVAVAHGKSDIDTQASLCKELHEMYNKAYLAPERNPQGGGVSLIEKLVNAGVTNFYKENAGKSDEKIGWYTGSANRPTMLLEWKEAIYKRLVIVRDKQAIEEHLTFIQEAGQQPRATKSAHDDFVICLSILWQIRKVMPTADYGVTTVSYRY